MRCVKNGTGDPSLCRAHRLVLAEAVKRPRSRTRIDQIFQHVPVDSARSVIDDLLSGRRVSKAKVATAINESVSWIMGGAYAAYGPDTDDTDIDESVRRGRFRPGSGFHPPPGWNQGQRAAHDPEAVQQRQRELIARTAMGFGPGDVLDAEIIKARYRELCKKYHPDRNQGSAVALERIKQINVANDVLVASLPKPKGKPTRS